MNNKARHTRIIKDEAARLGFMACGISRAEFLEPEAVRLEEWLSKGMHGEMHYMANHFDKRLDPTKLVEGAKSVVSLLLNYFPENESGNEALKISKYAYGNDYHSVIKTKLQEMMHTLRSEIGEVGGRVFVDSAPVMDKVWAARSGLGWVGKNSNLLNKQSGSFFFIAELIIDLELEYDAHAQNFCGTCTRCIDACPTQAIVEPYVVDGSKCISYFTIELKDQIPYPEPEKFGKWVFGCDICQDVCPWNRFSKPTNEKEFAANESLQQMKTSDWLELTEEIFKEKFGTSALSRTGAAGMKRNVSYISKLS